MGLYNRIAAMMVLCVAGVIAVTGAVTAGDVKPGDLLVLCNTTQYGHQGVWSYQYNAKSNQYRKSTEQLFIDLSSYPNNGIADITYGPDKNLYIVIPSGNVVKRYNGYTGAYMDDYVTHTSALTNITFSPSGKAYVSSAGEIYERQPDGTLARYAENPGSVNIYRMVFGPDNNGDGTNDLYVAGSVWNNGIYVYRYANDTATLFASAASGDYGLYECFCFGPGTTATYLYGDSQYKLGQPVAYHNGKNGAYIGSFTANVEGYCSDMKWGPDGNLYLAQYSLGKVMVYNSDGTAAYNFWVTETWGYSMKATSLEFVPHR